MTLKKLYICLLTAFFAAMSAFAGDLEKGWDAPPRDARVRAYWWWLNGCVDKAAITRDLEEMKNKGFAGALICDADGSSQDGNNKAPHGPTFLTPEWREMYKHALREADRLGLEMSLNIQSGWNLGGPSVTADDSAKKLVRSEETVAGPVKYSQKLKVPPGVNDGYYRDVAVTAYRMKKDSKRQPIKNWEQKAGHKPLHFSAPDTSILFDDDPAVPGEEDAKAADVLDLTDKLGKDGTLSWDAPDGTWQVLRFGYSIGNRSHVSTSSEGWKGYAIDVLDKGAFTRYWDAVVAPLIADAGPLAGSALKYLHTDSWEVEPLNWTPAFRDEFKKRRGYDMLPWMPTLAGRIIEDRRASNRFLADFQKTVGDLAVDNHYKPFRDGAHKHGLLIHPESGGPHAVPIDAQRCLGVNDAPMSEFWATSWRHRMGDANRFFVKQPASAAHTYGRKLVLAEGFTTIGPHWQETIWDNLKPSFDHALCEGLNVLVWHAIVCSPADQGMPGIQYFAGTHMNPNVTWWSRSGEFFSYINRCQFMLQQGLFVADACYYYGDHVPNFAQQKFTDPARILPGYDYDVVTEEILLTGMSVKDGRIVLPSGMSYRVLVLRDLKSISLPVLEKIRDLSSKGAVILGSKPAEASSLPDFRNNKGDFKRIADELWDKGKVVSGKTGREVLQSVGVLPDFEFKGGDKQTRINYIHRRADGTDIYFVANRTNRSEQVTCTFRVSGLVPELWDAVSGSRRTLPEFSEAGGRTTVPLSFAPCGSWFIVFKEKAKVEALAGGQPKLKNFPELKTAMEITGEWQVRFDPKWLGPDDEGKRKEDGKYVFSSLQDWTTRPEISIKHYSGTATYSKAFKSPELADKQSVWLDLGSVRELAEVRLNGKQLGVVWAPPFRVDVTGLLKPDENILEVDVVNFWPNRIIGDDFLTPEKRLTKTNIRKLTKKTPLMPSGLMGPVTLQVGETVSSGGK